MFKNIFSIKANADVINRDIWASDKTGRVVTEDPLQKYRFKLLVPNYDVAAGFSKCSGITDEIDVVEYAEGQWTYTHRIPGRNKVEPVTLERGAYATYDGLLAINEVRANPNMRATMELFIGRTQTTMKDIHISFKEAWVSKVEIGDLDATSGDILIEKMTIQFEYYTFEPQDGLLVTTNIENGAAVSSYFNDTSISGYADYAKLYYNESLAFSTTSGGQQEEDEDAPQAQPAPLPNG